MPKELGLHLRHFYVTHLIEAGYDTAIVQIQAGRPYSSITGLYTSVVVGLQAENGVADIERRITALEDPDA